MKYEKLKHYLENVQDEAVTLSFDGVEEIIGAHLPNSARQYPAWWANNYSQQGRHAQAWLNAGWKTEGLNFSRSTVTFRKDGLVTTDQTKPSNSAYIMTSTPMEMRQITLNMQWAYRGEVTLHDHGNLSFPSVPIGPGLYRMRLLSGDEDAKERRYVGETDGLSRRLQHYKTPGPSQRTNQRLNKLLIQHLQANGRVALDIITDGVTSLLDHEKTPHELDLLDKSARRLLEYAALYTENVNGYEVLNM